MSKQGGITLIGLAITIAVLLILAGISIVMLTGDNGIIKEANNAKEQVEISAEKENIDISVIEVLGQKTNGIIEKSDKDKFEENLRKNYNNQKIDVSVLENQDPYIFEVKYLQTKRSYYVTVDGDVSESIGKKLVIEYKTSKGNLITKKLHEYTKETITIGKLELSEEIKKKNNYEFSKAEIVKVDGSITNVNIIDKVTLDESINKITIIYSQKEIQTLTINPNGGNVGETSKKGAEGEQVQIPIPAPPSGNKITLNANGGTVSQTTLKTAYTFDRWNLSGGGTISGNTYTFGNQNGTVTALYIHRGITLPEPTRDGYIFKGWYTSSTGGTKVGDAGSIYAPIENITIYARWEKVPDLILDTNVFFEPDITTWTNKDVTVKARTTVQGYQIQLAAGNPEIESNWITTNSMTLKENGTVYARLTNGNLYGGYASYNVTNIDKVAPRQFQKDMTTIMADSISPDDTIHLQLNNIGDTESGVAKIKCYYRSEKENSYMFYLAYDRVPINGSERGKTDAYWSIDCKVKSSTFDGSWSQNNKVYMYAEVYDVAGNISRTWMASIDSDRKTTSYTEYE